MTDAEWVDKDFKLEGKTTRDLCQALNAYVKGLGLEIEEYGFSPAAGEMRGDVALPARFWNLIAFNVEGGSEGWYVHVGAIQRSDDNRPPSYIDFGFAKMWTPEKAYALAVAAQRFMSAIVWN